MHVITFLKEKFGATGVLRILEAVKLNGLADSCRIYQASTSELYHFAG